MPNETIELSPAQQASKTKAYNKFTLELKDQKEEILQWHQEIKNLHQDLIIDTPSRASKKAGIEATISEIGELSKKAASITNDINSIHEEITQEDGAKEKIDDALLEINSTIELVNQKKSMITDFASILDDQTDSDGAIIKKGLKSELKGLHENHLKLYNNHKETSKQLINQIEQTLAAATNVRLAQGFEIQKKSARNSKRLWASMFIISITLMVGIGIFFYNQKPDASPFTALAKQLLGEKADSLPTNTLLYIWIINFFQKAIIYIPLVWLAVISSKNQSQSARFEAEFSYKESVAITYNGHKSQLEDLPEEDADELLSKLAGNLIDAVSYNPSVTMEKDYHNNQPSILSRFKLGKAQESSIDKP